MKIKFVVGSPAKYCTSYWNEIQSLSKIEVGPDEEAYILFKALELNHELDRELHISRNKLGIPMNGISWVEYKRLHGVNIPKDTTDEETSKVLSFLKSYPNEISRISRKLKLHPLIFEQLKNLILGDFVEPYPRGIGYGTNVDDVDYNGKVFQDGDVESVQIHVNKRATKNEVLKSIERNWTEIERLINLLPLNNDFYVSNRDIRIVGLRDKEKMKYKDIAEKIIKEFSIDNIEGSINEDSIKTSYKRAKAKIVELAKSKKK